MLKWLVVNKSQKEKPSAGGREVLSPFVIQSHPDFKLFEVVSREIGFDHVGLMKAECTEGHN